MKKRIGVVAVVFAVVLVAVSGVFRASRIGALEQSPCRACPNAGQSLQQVSVCGLLARATQVDGEIVRVNGSFRNDAAQLFLVDGDCVLKVGIKSRTNACDGAWRKLQIVSGLDTWYDGAADVSVVGFVGEIPRPNYYAGERGFTITCVEAVRTEPTFWMRLNFALNHQLGPAQRFK